MTALLLSAVLASSPFVISPTFSGGTLSADLHLPDDVQLSYGNTDAAPDVWYVNNGTVFKLTSTSVDGSGTDGILWSYTLGGNTLAFGTTLVTIPAAGTFQWAGQVKCTSSGDGLMECMNNAGQGIRLDLTANGVAALTDEAGGLLSLTVNKYQIGSAATYLDTSANQARLVGNYGMGISQGSDNPVDGGSVLTITPPAGNDMTASSGDQYGIEGRTGIAQTSTAGYTAIFWDVTDDTSGSDQDYMLDLQWGGVSQVSVEDDGEMSVSGGNQKGALTWTQTTTESVTFQGGGGDASKTTTGTIIVDGDDVSHVTGRVVTAGTGCAGFSIGDGVDVDLWGADIAVADTTIFESNAATATWSHPALANQEITVTGTDGGGTPVNCVGLVVALTVHRTTGTAATSD